MPSPRPQFIELASVSESGHVQSIVTHCSPHPPPLLSTRFYKLLKYDTLSWCHLWLHMVHPLIYFQLLKIYFASSLCWWISVFFFLISFFLCRTHLSWSVCPCPSSRERAWHVSVLVKTTVERRATSPCKHPLHHRPPAVLLTHTRHRRVGEKRRERVEEEATVTRGKNERDSRRALGRLGFVSPAGTVCYCVALGTFKRGLGRQTNSGKSEKNGPL